MVMKDKLEKNNHKGTYYRARNCGVFGGLFAVMAVAIFIPTYISSISSSTVRAERAPNMSMQRHLEFEETEEVEHYISFSKTDLINR